MRRGLEEQDGQYIAALNKLEVWAVGDG